MQFETQPSSNLGLDEAIDPGPAIGPAEMVLLGVVMLVGLAVCSLTAWLYRKIIIKTPWRSHDD